jgi:DNA-binding MarR family transcriptional regulator
MHTSNVVVAWLATAQDRLDDGVAAVGLHPRELAALTLVHMHPDCSVEWLRARVGLTQSGTVRLVDRLAARGLLTRGPSTGRGVPLRTTPVAANALDRWGEIRDSIVAGLLDGVPATFRQSVVDAMAAALLAQSRRRVEADASCRRCSWAKCGDTCPVDHSVSSSA